MKKIVITELGSALVTALFENDKAVSFEFSSKKSGFTTGDIIIGRVNQVKQDLSAAFVDISPGETCYMPVDDVKQYHQGDLIAVQIEKPASRGKRILLTDKLSLAGRYIAVTEGVKPVGISQKISGEARRASLKNLINNNCGREPFKGFSFIIRTGAEDASDKAIIDEVNALSQELRDIRASAPYKTKYSMVCGAVPDYIRIIRDNIRDLEKIVTDVPAVYEKIKSSPGELLDSGDVTLKMYDDETLSLNKLYEIEYIIKDAISKRVWLRSGGYLIIEHTEALTVIDVNTGKADTKGGMEKNFAKINVEAAIAIAKELRLRNISGIIIVDFIDMKDPSGREELIAALKSAIASDPVGCRLHDITALGLAELTRKKTGAPLYEQVAKYGVFQ